MSSAQITTPLMGKDTSGMHIFDLVRHDHAMANELFNKYKSTTDMKEKQMIVYLLIRELSLHSGAEELTWYPMMPQKLGRQGQEFLDHSAKEHQTQKEDLEVLNTKTIDDPEAKAMFEKLIPDVLAHVKYEEEMVLPQLEKATSAEELRDLTSAWMTKKATGPTRPHASAGTPVPMAAAIASGPLDRAADMIRFGAMGETAASAKEKANL